MGNAAVRKAVKVKKYFSAKFITGLWKPGLQVFMERSSVARTLKLFNLMTSYTI